jgi:hypothetical protein
MSGMSATVIETKDLLYAVVASLVAGTVVTTAFSIMIFGAARFADHRRDDRPLAAAAAATLVGLGLAVTAASIVIGVIVMTTKA